jgi:hypothetical protein
VPPGPSDVTPPRHDAVRLAPRATRRRLERGAIRKWAPALVLVIVPVLLVSLHVRAYTKLSPIDELQHIDYLFRSPGVHQVIAGTKDSTPAMREEVCRGIDAVITLPPCSSKTLVPAEVQDQGYDTAYAHPPTYYDITWAVGKVVKPLTGDKSWVTTWRLLGALWLAAGLLVTYAAGLRMGVDRLPLLGLLVLLAAAPSIIETNSTVTPDATSTFVGGAALYLTSRWQEGGRWRWMTLVGIGFVGTAFKVQNAIVVMMIAIYLLLSARSGAVPAPNEDRDTADLETIQASAGAGPLLHGAGWPRRLLYNANVRGAGILVATTAAIGGAWTILQRATETIDPNKLLVNQQFVVSSITLQQIASTFGAFLAPLPGAFVPGVSHNAFTDDMVSLLSWLLIAGVVGGAVFLARTPRMASLARATLITALFAGPIFVVLNYVSMSQYIPLPTRYGFALLPAMVLCTADAIRTRWAALGTLGAGLLGVALVAYRLA